MNPLERATKAKQLINEIEASLDPDTVDRHSACKMRLALLVIAERELSVNERYEKGSNW